MGKYQEEWKRRLEEMEMDRSIFWRAGQQKPQPCPDQEEGRASLLFWEKVNLNYFLPKPTK